MEVTLVCGVVVIVALLFSIILMLKAALNYLRDISMILVLLKGIVKDIKSIADNNTNVREVDNGLRVDYPCGDWNCN